MARRDRHHARLLWDAERWRRRAAGKVMGAALFFPVGEREDDAVAQAAAAKQVCASCGARLHCLAFALVLEPQDGIWGGLGPSERRALRRARQGRRARRRAQRAGNDAAVDRRTASS